jgi:hypothetical protein
MILRLDANTQRIHATVVGLFETKTPIEDLVYFSVAHPEGWRIGFGHLGAWPAQILVKTIADMRIEQKPQPMDQK